MAASPSGPRGGHPDEGEDSDNDGDHGGGNTMISCWICWVPSKMSRGSMLIRSGIEYGRIRGRLGEPGQCGGADGEQGDDDYADAEAVGLTQSEGMVMRYLLLDGAAAAPSQIAAATGLQRTNLSTTLRGLEHKGMIQRQTSPADGRGATVSPTEHGRTNSALVRHEWATAVREAAGDDNTHLDAALTLLTTIRDGLVKTRPQSPSHHPPA